MRNWMVGLASVLAISGALAGSGVAAPLIGQASAGTNDQALLQPARWERQCFTRTVTRWTPYGYQSYPVERCQRVWVRDYYRPYYAPSYAPYGYPY